MTTSAMGVRDEPGYPIDIHVAPALDNRNRLTTAFRFILAIPHLVLVGAPIALMLSWRTSTPDGPQLELGAAGVIGAAAAVVALISWFAVVFTGRHPAGLWNFGAFYLRWRVRAVAYMALLRDEYPPFGEGQYPAALELRPAGTERDRLTVGFRLILALPHIFVVWVLGVGWAFTTLIAWFAILLTGRYPEGLYRFGVGVFRWSTRVEGYLLLFHDEYPPFSLDE